MQDFNTLHHRDVTFRQDVLQGTKQAKPRQTHSVWRIQMHRTKTQYMQPVSQIKQDNLRERTCNVAIQVNRGSIVVRWCTGILQLCCCDQYWPIFRQNASIITFNYNHTCIAQIYDPKNLDICIHGSRKPKSSSSSSKKSEAAASETCMLWFSEIDCTN